MTLDTARPIELPDVPPLASEDAAPATRPRRARVADLFCGAGGTSSGAAKALERLGWRMELVAVNHWPVAIETHTANHPGARHHCTDLESARPEDLIPEGRLDILLASPTCTFHSRARGGKPIHDQQRMDPWIVVRWCTALRVKRVIIENVPEFLDWGPLDLRTGRPIKSRRGEYFRAWRAALEACGFRTEYRIVNCADHGDATTRKRFFLLARSDGRRIRWPEPSHAPRDRAAMLGLAPWRAAREIIDWSIQGRSIFDRPRPLAPNTIRRITAGVARFEWPEPFLIILRNNATARGIDLPLPTITAGGGHVGLVEPFVSPFYGDSDGRPRAAQSVDEPLPTVTTGPRFGLAEPFVLSQGAGGAPRAADDPMPTIVGGGALSLIEPFTTTVTGTDRPKAPRPVDEPLGTITGRNGACLVEPLIAPYYGGGSGLTCKPASDPLDTVTTKARFGVVEPFIVPQGSNGAPRSTDDPAPTIVTTSRGIGLVTGAAGPIDAAAFARAVAQGRVWRTSDGGTVLLDIRFRMLTWRELARAMSFSEADVDYEFSGTSEQITKQIGNAVPVRTAAALVGAMMEA